MISNKSDIQVNKKPEDAGYTKFNNDFFTEKLILPIYQREVYKYIIQTHHPINKFTKTNEQISEAIHLSAATINKSIKHLKEKNLITIIKINNRRYDRQIDVPKRFLELAIRDYVKDREKRYPMISQSISRLSGSIADDLIETTNDLSHTTNDLIETTNDLIDHKRNIKNQTKDNENNIDTNQSKQRKYYVMNKKEFVSAAPPQGGGVSVIHIQKSNKDIPSSPPGLTPGARGTGRRGLEQERIMDGPKSWVDDDKEYLKLLRELEDSGKSKEDAKQIINDLKKKLKEQNEQRN